MVRKTEIEYRLEEIIRRDEIYGDVQNVYTPLPLCREMIDKLPKINENTKILVMFNLEFVYLISEILGRKNMQNVWFLTRGKLKRGAALNFGLSENHVVNYKYNIKEINLNMKFDVIVGNPPYKRNLHLKLLKIACDALAEDGEIIWIHPARWMQDVLAPYKRNSDFLKYKDLPFINIEFINSETASSYFKNFLQTDLIISTLKDKHTSILNENKIYYLRNIPTEFKNLINFKFNSIESMMENNKIDGIRVKVKSIIPTMGHGAPAGGWISGVYKLFNNNDIIINGKIGNKWWSEVGQKNGFTKPVGSPIPFSIKFNTIEEAQNFIDYANTDVFLFFNFLTKLDVNVQLRYLPMMNDYTQPWTNERLQSHFNISDEGMQFILKTMKKYK